MNQLINQSVKTMSSKDLLEIINQVRSDMGEPLLRMNSFNLKIEDELDGENYTKNVVENNNATISYIYDLTIDQCILIGMRESKSVRKSVLAILKNKEDKFYIPQTYGEALQLCADQAKKLELAAPKVEYFDKVAERSTLLNATQVGQKVGMSAIKMNLRLSELGVYNKAIKRSRVFQQWFIEQGLGELKQTETGHSQAMFTTKGEQWIIEKFISEGLV